VSVQEHELFTRQGDDLVYELAVNMAQAALGTELEVPTLDGNSKLKIPAGSQSGAIFRVKNKGVTHLRGGGRGDQLVQLKVTTPESLTKRQRELLQELAETMEPATKGR
jgi:molecular chaperone DnaJ